MHKKTVLIQTIRFVLIGWAILAVVLCGTYFFLSHEKLSVFSQKELAGLEIISNRLLEEQNKTIEDLFLFTDMQETNLVLHEDQKAKDLVSYVATLILRSRTCYDQIRIMDCKGKERIRVNYNGGVPKVITNTELQDKSARYYFNETKNLRKGQTYISPFDLNVEQGKMETPYKPMIRYIVGLYEEEKSEPVGFVIINYLADHILALLDDFAQQKNSDLYLLDDKGYYLYGPDPNVLWGFQLPDHASHNLATENPELWAKMQDSPEGSFSKNGHLQFFVAVDPTTAAIKHMTTLGNKKNNQLIATDRQDTLWFLLTDVNKQQWLQYIDLLRKILLVIGLLGVPIIVITGYSFAKKDDMNKSLHQQLVEDATKDPLTKVYNRKAGLELMEKAIKNKESEQKSLSLCFFDLNNLKAVNDQLGHDQGDLFITTLATCLVRICPKESLICRLGGDEFLALIKDCTPEEAEDKLGQLNAILQAKGMTYACPIPWSVSFGCVAVIANGTMNLDELISKADLLMYQRKTKMKEELQGTDPLYRQ
ncbi:MAG: sensor domain-containing diguanylate cyclase [Spirochaetia bacterium]|jgi:diguanylate cyclase (GGDEF)-like protein|nr:sensor domain-containing diguanylate cyclase [Spirochaetia bacterium]